jgi:hypothetical protein
VLVGNPFGELLHVLFDLVVLGVEDVDPVLGGPDPVLVNEVVAVAADVIPLVQHQDATHVSTNRRRCVR